MKLELGGSGANVGGKYARGDGWVNIDVDQSADIVHDLNVAPWPIDDESVDAVYSSHCFEHLNGPFVAFAELCRVCKVGAPIEIRVPAPGSHLAMTWDHKYVLSPMHAINCEKYFPQDFWRDPKRLRFDRYEYGCSELLQRAYDSLPFLDGIDPQVVMEFFPTTAHETRLYYTCVANEFYRGG